jgi:hypothetical protein
MALLTIGGRVMPTPSEFTANLMDISKAERNASGDMVIERITTKKKLQVKYTRISATDLSTILNAISPTQYPVTYLDPLSNNFVTAQFYCGDRSAVLTSFIDNVAVYKDFSFDLIQI